MFDRERRDQRADQRFRYLFHHGDSGKHEFVCGDSSNVTTFNFFWQYAATLTTYISSYSCGTGATLSYNGSSYVCTYTATTTYSCSNGGTLSGSSCITVSTTIYGYQCVNSGTLGNAVWTSEPHLNSPYYGYCTWTIGANPAYTCPNGGSSGGTQTCTYLATPNYSSYYACPLGGTLGTTLCSISGGSGPNLRRTKASVQIVTKVREDSTKGTS